MFRFRFNTEPEPEPELDLSSVQFRFIETLILGSSCIKPESEEFILYVVVFDKEVWCDKKRLLLEV